MLTTFICENCNNNECWTSERDGCRLHTLLDELRLYRIYGEWAAGEANKRKKKLKK